MLPELYRRTPWYTMELIKKIESSKEGYRWWKDIYELGCRKDPRAVEPLIKILLETRDPEERVNVAKALGMIQDKRAIPVLREVLKKEHDKKTRIILANMLYKIGDREDKEMVFPILIEVKSYSRIAKDRDRRILPYLKEALKDEDYLFRISSAYDLYKYFEDESALRCLEELARDCEDKFIRGHALKMLGLLKDEKATAIIEDVLFKEEKDEYIREKALEILKRMETRGRC